MDLAFAWRPTSLERPPGADPVVNPATRLARRWGFREGGLSQLPYLSTASSMLFSLLLTWSGRVGLRAPRYGVRRGPVMGAIGVRRVREAALGLRALDGRAMPDGREGDTESRVLGRGFVSGVGVCEGPGDARFVVSQLQFGLSWE